MAYSDEKTTQVVYFEVCINDELRKYKKPGTE